MTTISNVHFLWFDYLIVITMLFTSTIIGVYFAWFQKKPQTVKDYILGGKQLAALPVGISVAASHISGGSLILVPAEVYKYGAFIIWAIPGFAIIALLGIYVFLPILFKLKVTSIFEYLEKRFDAKTKVFAILLCVIPQIISLAFIISTSSIILATGTEVDPFLLSIICTVICVFYTAIGGLKTVVWSDILQFGVVLVTYVIVLIAGIQSVGGIRSVFKSAWNGQRLDVFDFDIDPTKRDTFWTILLGYGGLNLYYKLIDQAAVQKFLAVPKLRDCVKSIAYSAISVSIVYILVILTGLTIYARYHSCDPFSAGKTFKMDQIVPYFVMDVARDIPGVTGFFVAGILSAGLGSMSSTLNSISGVIYNDIISKTTNKKFSDKTAKNIMKLFIVGQGLVCVGISYWFRLTKELFSFAMGTFAVLNGPMLGVVILGMMCPKATAGGAFYGSILSFIIIAIVSFTSIYYQNQGFIIYPTKPLSTFGCQSNVSKYINYQTIKHDISFIFKISFYYRAIIATILTIIFGLILSYTLCKSAKTIDKNLLFQKNNKKKPDPKYLPVETSFQNVNI